MASKEELEKRIAELEANAQQAEQSRRQTEKMFQLVMDSIPQFIFWKDTESVYLGCNSNFARAAGVGSPVDIVGKTDYDLAWKKEEADAFRQDDREAMETDTPKLHIVEPQLQADGRQAWLETNKIPLHDDEGNVVGVLGTFQDITERQQMEEEFWQEKAFSDAIINSLPGVFYVYNQQGKLIRWNDALEQVTGYASEEITQLSSALDLIAEDERETVMKRIEQVLTTGEANVEAHILTKNGEAIPHFLTGLRLVRDGEVYGVGVGLDITERKQADQERIELQQEVIEAQRRAIQELSTPVIPIMDRIIVMPMVGSIDSMRARDITRSLLEGIGKHRAKIVILDVTGVSLMDTGIVNHLNKTIQAARLKGAQTIITGISDAVAESIVDLGIDWSGITTLSDLQTGLLVALNSLGVRLTN